MHTRALAHANDVKQPEQLTSYQLPLFHIAYSRVFLVIESKYATCKALQHISIHGLTSAWSPLGRIYVHIMSHDTAATTTVMQECGYRPSRVLVAYRLAYAYPEIHGKLGDLGITVELETKEEAIKAASFAGMPVDGFATQQLRARYGWVMISM